MARLWRAAAISATPVAMDPEDAPLAVDPRGLIREAYRMELGPADCRAIFFDWALGLDGLADARAVSVLLGHYGPAHPDHPMTAVLRDGLAPAAGAGRRRRRPR